MKISKSMLNGFAPKVLPTGNSLSREYLRLGYRDLALAKITMIMADNIRETLYSLRLLEYSKAVKLIKHSRQYAFYSLMNLKDAGKNKMGLLPHDFDKLLKLLPSISKDKKELKYFTQIHYDNYFKTTDKKSIYSTIWSGPNINTIDPFKTNYFQSQKEKNNE